MLVVFSELKFRERSLSTLLCWWCFLNQIPRKIFGYLVVLAVFLNSNSSKDLGVPCCVGGIF